MAGKKGGKKGKEVSRRAGKGKSKSSTAGTSKDAGSSTAESSKAAGKRARSASRGLSKQAPDPCQKCKGYLDKYGRTHTGKAYPVKRILAHDNKFIGETENVFRYQVQFKGKCHTDGCIEWLKSSSLKCDRLKHKYWKAVKESGERVEKGGQVVMNQFLATYIPAPGDELESGEEYEETDEDVTGDENTTSELDTDDDDDDDDTDADFDNNDYDFDGDSDDDFNEGGGAGAADVGDSTIVMAVKRERVY